MGGKPRKPSFDHVMKFHLKLDEVAEGYDPTTVANGALMLVIDAWFDAGRDIKELPAFVEKFIEGNDPKP